jgi:DNA topoisomerase-3
VELLKVASSAMGMSPQQAMREAEGLYTSGYISYPRTESSAYPPGFNFQEVLVELRRSPLFGDYAGGLLAAGYAAPKVGRSLSLFPSPSPGCKDLIVLPANISASSVAALNHLASSKVS